MKSSLHDSGGMRLDEFRRIEVICTEFESRWQPQSVDFRKWLRDTEGRFRASLYCELVKLDIELRRDRGEKPAIDDYSPADLDVDVDLVTDDFWKYVADEPEAESLPSLASDRYVITERLGVGGIGAVYRAYDRISQRSIAVKMLRPRHASDQEAIQRFDREGLLTGRLQHPGIPPIYDRGELDDGTSFFTMKVIEGQTLDEILKEPPTTDSNTNAEDVPDSRQDPDSEQGKTAGYFFQLFDKVAQTVAYAHGQGVIHRDLKPQNVMVGQFGEVQVMDWGLAKQIESTSESASDPSRVDANQPSEITNGKLTTSKSSVNVDQEDGWVDQEDGLTTAGDFIGTPRHMSPEQSRGETAMQSPSMDVFGLGTILYQILTGQTLFPGDTTREALLKTQRGDLGDAYQTLDELQDGGELVDLCRRCLSVDPNQRPASAAEVAKQTQAYLAKLQQELADAKIQESKQRVQRDEARKRLRWLVGIGTTSAIAVAIAGAFGVAQWFRATAAADQERQSRLIAERDSRSVHEINDFLTRILSATRPENEGSEVTHRQVVSKAIAEIEGRFADQPFVEGSLRLTLGETFRWLDDVEMAEEQLRLSIEALERADEGDKLKLLEAKDRLAAVLLIHDSSDDQPEAIRLRQDVLQTTLPLLGETHRRTVDAKIKLAEILTYSSQHDEAGRLLSEASQTIKQTPELASMDTRRMMLTLARVRKHQDRYPEAIALYKTLLNDPGSSAVIRLPAMTQLGELYHWDEDLEQAEDMMLRSLELHRKELSPDHRATLSTMRKYFRILEQAGSYEELLRWADESISLHERWDGLARTSVLEARSRKARALFGLDRPDEAEAVLRESLRQTKVHRKDDLRHAKLAQEELDAFLAGRDAYLSYRADFDWY